MAETAAETPPEIPAATLVVFRRAPDGGAPELLMVVRSRDMSFAGGMAVFPGGRVDPEDHQLARALGGPFGEEETAHRIAAIRETLEETGLALGFTEAIDRDRALAMRVRLEDARALAPVLDEFRVTLALDRLVPFARWCPRGMAHSRIFDTRFYLYDIGTGAVELAVDATENTRLFWITAAQALERADQGDLSVIFPTRRNLERLAQFESFADARAHAESIPVRTIIPQRGKHEGRPALMIPDDCGYPVTFEWFDTTMRG
ncbi:NUDIX domain-containing protein [Qipengyuania sp.]|uniref:NUDIX hydrolase n=1 Tax=Qipengyuania sp. TaxID=2004515 RepID=UPI0035C8661B